MKLLLVGNYPRDVTYSMNDFRRCLEAGLTKRGVEVTLIKPERQIAFGKGLAAKWLGYADKFLFFPSKLRRAAALHDVVHVCDQGNAMYVRHLRGRRHLVTCHDMLAIKAAQGENPEWKVGPTGKVFQTLILSGLKEAQTVAAVCRTTQADLFRIAGREPSNTTVIYNALYKAVPELQADNAATVVRRLLGSDGPYLLHVGSDAPQKNRWRLVRAYALLASEFGERSPRLVLAGRALSGENTEFIAKANIGHLVVNVKSPTDEELWCLYRCAKALVVPSLAEGFGLPIIEAQSMDCPVVASNREPMPEVAGDGAIFFEPTEIEDMASKIKDALADLPALSAKGAINVQRFKPEEMISGYMAAYDRVLSNS